MGLFSWSVRPMFDRFLKFPRIDRLDQVIIESRLNRALTVGFQSVSCQSNQAYILCLWILTQTPCNLVPVDLRQPDIKQHDVGLKFLGCFQRSRARVCLPNLMP